MQPQRPEIINRPRTVLYGLAVQGAPTPTGYGIVSTGYDSPIRVLQFNDSSDDVAFPAADRRGFLGCAVAFLLRELQVGVHACLVKVGLAALPGCR